MPGDSEAASGSGSEDPAQPVAPADPGPRPSGAPSIPPRFTELLSHQLLQLRQQIERYLTSADVERVFRAYADAERHHRPQVRKTGEPYILHPVAATRMLAEMGLDADTLCACLLHDVIEDSTEAPKDVIRQQLSAAHGDIVVQLVDGVTKLDQIHFDSKEAANAESVRKLMLATNRDPRVILIKLADRLHNMRTIEGQSKPKRRQISLETLELYAPLAHRYGINRIKAELQDLCFRTLLPWRARIIAQRADEKRGARNQVANAIQDELKSAVGALGINARILHRVKSPYSIYRKMTGRSTLMPCLGEGRRLVYPNRRSFRTVTDVQGFRIIVGNVEDCYRVLGAVHQMYRPQSGGFKDYIAVPKDSGYRSLHTVVRTTNTDAQVLEIQIRTQQMDVVAESGIAAHWAYKSGVIEDSQATAQVREWLRQIAENPQQPRDPAEYLSALKADLSHSEEILVLTPKGKVIKLPPGATAIDFAYAIHADVGNRAVMARIDGRYKPLRTELKNEQQVHIICADHAEPQLQWLDHVHTSRARQSIRQRLGKLNQSELLGLGQRLLEGALSNLGSSLDALPKEALDEYLGRMRLPSFTDLLVDLAQAVRLPGVVARQLLDGKLVTEAIDAADPIPVSGPGAVALCRNCHPMPGDPSVGVMVRSQGVVVHRSGCKDLKVLERHPDRRIKLRWEAPWVGPFHAAISVDVEDRRGTLASVAGAIAEAECDIDTSQVLARDGSGATLGFTIRVRDPEHLEQVLRTLRKRKGLVIGADRAPPG
jgi:guanosine-3',5'-bis(diphosphate) 3'-pyrophosphohydrolase